MVISQLITDIRLDINDRESSRFTDAEILSVVKKALVRLAHILFRNDIEAGRLTYEFTTIEGVSDYPLPYDFMKDVGLYKPNGISLPCQTDKQWETIISANESSVYIIRAGTLYIAGTPTTSTQMKLIYWKLPEVLELTVDDEMPYNGKFDYMVAEYVGMRLKNIDESDVSRDVELLADMENQILATYGSQTPTVVRQRGWLP